MPPAVRPRRALGLILPVTLAIALATETGQRGLPGAASAQDSVRRFVDVIEVTGAITPITVEQIESQLRRSDADGAQALVLVMDTPGGLESSMRSIVKAILASRIPVVTWVSPPGARAASAGLFIVTASHVAAMAPNTNLGAASPVSIGGPADTTMAKKATSDAAALIQGLAETRGRNVEWNVKAVREAVSASANEAVGLRVVDFVASDLRGVLEKASGRTVQLAGGPLRLDLAGAEIHQITPTRRHRVLSWLANPNVAYLLLTLGFYGILFELQSPGAILPGVAGAILLVLGFVALQMLPVNIAGLVLMLLAMAFFILEVKVQSHGVLAVGGVAAFLFGSLLLFEPGPGRLFRVSLPIVLGATTATAALFTFVVGKALGAQRRPVTTGAEGMLAEIGEAITPLDPRGRVRVHGEIWEAESRTGPLEVGTEVEVTRVRGLTLEVRARSQKGD
ncbi:MAG TPA: nodulation protein NfeD [Gemmatimonadaceae bacterium]|nr:nodulation protein NfeD [Gemmatimonadaceae bacterium]